MLTQKIIGTEYKTVKYHGNVKFLIFECNNCSKQFSKMESYSKKQLKIHKNACCFCSPNCRNIYFNQKLMQKLEMQNKTEPPSSPPPLREPEAKKKESTSFFGWLNKVLEG